MPEIPQVKMSDQMSEVVSIKMSDELVDASSYVSNMMSWFIPVEWLHRVTYLNPVEWQVRGTRRCQQICLSDICNAGCLIAA